MIEITHEQLIADTEVNIPEWIDSEGFDGADIAAIQYGGCDSGAYMPAVIYHVALKTMEDHGDDVLEFIEEQLGELPQTPEKFGWSTLASFYLAFAVELWVGQFEVISVND